ncbi:LuxR C-terminal-related transcriptional regulator [Paenibacillus sp. HWE-109]|uniref:LuxR C-terminal-related transcriptional regulator n=1 Tax=Paenibacillus sp. HWE-109 TaxID=1306526 RepID=UPI001EDE2222|nr:LuxR C-terminal-related transcriptional regulator [Paenibacillus sp. HWE-109]UKS31203.1 LuxR C-terminal-related transcriptional regulator [Paenibacillus sp. HWE-109]
MTIPIISTKLYIPPSRPNVVVRPRLIERMNEGLHRKLTVISASAGSGKTTLLSEWLACCDRPVAWLSMDEGENDPTCFLTYLFASLQSIATSMGDGVFGFLQSPQLPPMESMIATLINEVSSIQNHFVLVLDDYHVIKAGPIDQAIALLIERMPPQMHLVIATREDPRLPLGRLRVRDQLTEVRAADLRFTSSEAGEFMDQVMGLQLSRKDITLLESRTEGWVAGLQLAALSIKGQSDASSFIQSFGGSHHFVVDYLVEEVLQQQSANVLTFLLSTSILDRLCGPLCDALLDSGLEGHLASSSSGQEILEYLEQANLFIVPLDSARHWYRYHHLFGDLLRTRLQQSMGASISAELHIRASEWYEDNGQEIEAFHHAVAAHDIERAARLVEGKGVPLLFRGAVAPVRNWLDSLSQEELDARPSLWAIYASSLLLVGQTTGVEQKLQSAERALQGAEQGTEQDAKNLDTIGHIAAIRATLAVSKHEAATIIAESNRALAYLHPDNLPVRTATIWSLGYAYHLQGDRAAASKAYTEALSNSQLIGHVIITILASLGLGNIQVQENQLALAAETFLQVLQLAGDPPMAIACEAHLGLARIFYEWDDLEAAERHGQQNVLLARQFADTDRVIAGEVFLARLMLAQGKVSGAAALLTKADHLARQHNYGNQIPNIADVQVLVQLQQGHLEAAAHLAEKNGLIISQARVHLAKGNTILALRLLESKRSELKDEQLKSTVLMAVALHWLGDKAKASQILLGALTMAEPGGFIRTFVDEGTPVNRLLCEVAAQGIRSDYIDKLLAVFEAEVVGRVVPSENTLIEPLSGRELEVLKLIAQGLSNRQISERLFLSLSTVKGHNQHIFDKLQVKRRTEAVAQARKLGLL